MDVDLDNFLNEGFEDSILCENEESASTIAGELNTIRFISTKVTDLLGHHVATDCFKFKDSHQANILTD